MFTGPQDGRLGPRAHSPRTSPLRLREMGPPRPPARRPGAVTFQRLTQASQGGEQGGGAGARLSPGGGTRKLPPRPEPPCNRRRPELSLAGPSDPPAMGDEDEDEGCAVELQITEGGAAVARGAGRAMAAQAGWEGSCTGWVHLPPVPAANLTGHEEKVGVENFQLLKVLGTGGEEPYPPAGVPGMVPRASRLHTHLGWARLLAVPPQPLPALPALPCPAMVCTPTPRAAPR